jgi:hydroxymethylglutaryl-CoA lyase
MSSHTQHGFSKQVDVTVSEVGPRDGLQSIKSIMPTASKLAWITALANAGLAEIEVGSFVSPKLLPQMADTAEIVAGSRAFADVQILALVPNLRGAERAFAAGTRRLTMPVSASRLHSLSNVKMTPEQAVSDVEKICLLRDHLARQNPESVLHLEVGISTAFGCTMEGSVSEEWVIKLAIMLARAGADIINLSDTTGMGNPAQVRRLFRLLQKELGDKAGGAHFHNTRGQGLANVVAALETDVRTFDSSQGGLGGCPYAPGATGNIVTEDLVYLLEAMGLRTGVNMQKLLEAREVLKAALPHEPLYGHVPDAGLPKGFVNATEQRSQR